MTLLNWLFTHDKTKYYQNQKPTFCFKHKTTIVEHVSAIIVSFGGPAQVVSISLQPYISTPSLLFSFSLLFPFPCFFPIFRENASRQRPQKYLKNKSATRSASMEAQSGLAGRYGNQ